jgi:hypothetical protein
MRGGIINDLPFDVRQATTPVLLPAAPPPYLPDQSPVPPVLDAPATDVSPWIVAAADNIPIYVKQPKPVDPLLPVDLLPDVSAPVLVDGVPLTTIAADPIAAPASTSYVAPAAGDGSSPLPDAAPQDIPLAKPVPAVFYAGAASGIVADPTTAAALDPNAAPAAAPDPNVAPAAVTSGSQLSVWWLAAIAAGAWYFWFRK